MFKQAYGGLLTFFCGTMIVSATIRIATGKVAVDSNTARVGTVLGIMFLLALGAYGIKMYLAGSHERGSSD